MAVQNDVLRRAFWIKLSLVSEFCKNPETSPAGVRSYVRFRVTSGLLRGTYGLIIGWVFLCEPCLVSLLSAQKLGLSFPI